MLVAQGDHVAFETLYDALAPAVYGVTLRVVQQPAQAQEVAQEVLLEVWQQAPRYERSRGSVRTWVLTIAHRRAVDRVRSAQAATDREARAAATGGTVPHDHVVEEVQGHLDSEEVRRCLQSLTPVQRESVVLAYYGGHSYPEVARLLDAPLPTVKTRLRDGLIRLRDCLGVTA
jgi:RNA polymerase sigma-70 factor (ECF subfamily)